MAFKPGDECILSPWGYQYYDIPQGTVVYVKALSRWGGTSGRHVEVYYKTKHQLLKNYEARAHVTISPLDLILSPKQELNNLIEE